MDSNQGDYSNAKDLLNAGVALLFVVVVLIASTLWLRADDASWPDVPADMEAVREHLNKYQDPLAAIRDCYFSTLGCVIYPDGNMGLHFVNMALMGTRLDPMSPQILLYEPVDGKLRLTGAEWFVPLSTGVEERPELFGQEFEGPMEGHFPVLPLELHHYDLHVWLYKKKSQRLVLPFESERELRRRLELSRRHRRRQAC